MRTRSTGNLSTRLRPLLRQITRPNVNQANETGNLVWMLTGLDDPNSVQFSVWLGKEILSFTAP